jgi:hypothetical protein
MSMMDDTAFEHTYISMALQREFTNGVYTGIGNSTAWMATPRVAA